MKIIIHSPKNKNEFKNAVIKMLSVKVKKHAGKE